MDPSSILKFSDDSSISESNSKYKQVISNLSETTDGWLPSITMHKYQDFWFAPFLVEGIMAAQEHFTARPSDIITCSYPKSGTTWLKSLCFAILTRTQFVNSPSNPLLSRLPHEIVPNIERAFHEDPMRDSSDIPLWPTHIPYTLLPRSVIESNCKIVYICRNPKDVFVSLWHFAARIGGLSTEDSPLEKAFQKFCKGESAYGPYWDHVLEYWKASLQFPDKILFIKYEDLQNDTSDYVKRLAEFMGCPFSAEEEKEGLIQKIVELCSFENLSSKNKSGEDSAPWPIKIENNAFFRKGRIGDWKNHLTAEMVAQIDQIADDKFKNFGLSFNTPAP